MRFLFAAAGALSQPHAASPPPLAAWEIFPMVACPSPPYFNKSLEEGQGIPPSSSYTSQPAPHLLCPPSLPGQARERWREPGLCQRWSGCPAHAQSSCTPSFMQTGTSCCWGFPQPVIQVLVGEECLGPPATLQSGVPKNCKSQTHPRAVSNLRNGISAQKAVMDQAGIWLPCILNWHPKWPGAGALGLVI